jgi:hypothetical protein
MATRIPLVLSGIAITELKPGDSIAPAPKFIPVTLRSNVVSRALIDNGPYLPVVKRNNSVINITLAV